eukprot:3538049-Rhodomonas_salina.1
MKSVTVISTVVSDAECHHQPPRYPGTRVHWYPGTRVPGVPVQAAERPAGVRRNLTTDVDRYNGLYLVGHKLRGQGL